MTVISVDLTNAPYDIHVRAGLMAQAPEYLVPYARDNRLLVVTDENVARAVWPALEAALSAAGVKTAAYFCPRVRLEKAGLSWKS